MDSFDTFGCKMYPKQFRDTNSLSSFATIFLLFETLFLKEIRLMNYLSRLNSILVHFLFQIEPQRDLPSQTKESSDKYSRDTTDFHIPASGSSVIITTCYTDAILSSFWAVIGGLWSSDLPSDLDRLRRETRRRERAHESWVCAALKSAML